MSDSATAAIEAARFIDRQEDFDALVEEVGAADRYAIDTEFHRERTYYAHLALLQIAWPEGIALVDPLAVDVSGFAQVLAGPGLALVHACEQDLEILERSCGRAPRALFDTQVAAGFAGMSSPSLGSLVERFLGTRLEKGDQLTDWTRRPLNEGQRRYAAGDVAYLIELHRALVERLEASGRLGWAEAECALVLANSRRVADPEEAWWKLRQSRQLRGPQRGVAQSVAAWRERRAALLDQPVRNVLSDLALASIAQRPPKSRADLEAVRGIDGRHLAGGAAAELLTAVQEGARLSQSELHLPPVAPEVAAARPAIALAIAFTAERARTLGIDAAILATRADVVGYLNDPPEGRLATSWREGLVGEPIRRLVAGEAALAVSGSTLVLEERSSVPIPIDGDPDRSDRTTTQSFPDPPDGDGDPPSE